MNAWMNQMDPIHLNRYKLPRPGNTSWKSFHIKSVSKTVLCRRLISFLGNNHCLCWHCKTLPYLPLPYKFNEWLIIITGTWWPSQLSAMRIISPWQWSNSLYLPLSLFHFGQLHSQSLSTLYKSHDIAAGILDKELRNPCFLSLEPVSPKFSL